MTFRQSYLRQRGRTRGLDPKRKLRCIEWAVFYTAGDLLADADCRPELVGEQVNLQLWGGEPRLRCLDTLHRFVERVERLRPGIEDGPDVPPTEEEEAESERAAAAAFAGLVDDGVFVTQ